MLELVSVRFKNFMPYLGEHDVNFPQDATQNVLVVFGDNMTGKTSLLNAVRWCLYGVALDRNRKNIPLSDLVNMDARDSGDTEFWVELRFKSSGVDYQLRRTARVRELVHRPKHDSDFEVGISLRKGKAVLAASDVEREISQIAPYQTARFFLFDAELLAEYEDLVVEDSGQGKRIREAIEQVLGVPALTHGKNELTTLRKEASKILAKEEMHSEQLQGYSAQYNRIEEELEELREDHTKLLDQKAECQDTIAGLDDELRRTEAAQKAQQEIDGLLHESERLSNRNADLAAERLSAAANAWHDLLTPRIRQRVTELSNQRKSFEGQMRRRGSLEKEIEQLKSLLGRSECPVCDQEIAEDRRTVAGTKLGELEGEIQEIALDGTKMGEIASEIERLSKIASTESLRKLKANAAETGANAVAVTDLENRLSSLQAHVVGFDTAEIARRRSYRDKQMQKLGGIDKLIGESLGEMQIRESKQEQLSKLMSKTPESRTRRSAKEVELYSGLEKVFGDSIALLRNELRSAVQAHATEAFAHLITDKTYKGLSINAAYGLTIVDRDDRTVTLRSAGAEQIVALALIHGLSATGGRIGPIVIDTPLARLDPKHRKNVLSFLPNMANQVVLLVHEGEVDRETGLEPLAERIGGICEIEPVTSSHSRLLRN